MVGNRRVGVRSRPRRDRAVECVRTTEVTGDGTGSPVRAWRARERHPAQRAVVPELTERHRHRIARPSHPRVAGRSSAVRCAPPRPNRGNVARSLSQPLPGDDTEPVVRERRRADVRLEHRRLRFLHLQDQAVATGVARTFEQADPTPGPHAADADDPPGHVDDSVPVEEVAISCESDCR